MTALNDRPAQTLRNLVAERGIELADDPLRLTSLLRDECGEYKAEIHVLAEAARAQIPADLNTITGEPLDLAIRRLAARLSSERGTVPSAAQWAVEAWATALGLTVSGANLAKPASVPSAPGTADPDHAAAFVQPRTGVTPFASPGTTEPAPTLLQRLTGWFRHDNGQLNWIKTGSAALAAMVLLNLVNNDASGDRRPGDESSAKPAHSARITRVAHLSQFPADGRKTWFHIEHTGNVDRIDVQFQKGDWKNLILTPKSADSGARFSFWLSAQHRDVGRARLIPVYQQQIAGEPFELEFEAIGSTDLLPPGDSPIRVTQVNYNRQAPADGGKQKFEVEFSNDDGNPVGLELIVLRGRLDHQLLRYPAKGERNGRLEFHVDTRKPENIVFRLRLLDSRGRRSNVVEVPFEVIAAGRPGDRGPRR